METKELILEKALGLFAARGYSAVSIRELCKEVGIKESTIYYHFKNKQDILDTLKEHFFTVANGMMESLQTASGAAQQITEEGFLRINRLWLEIYLLDPFINRFIRVLNIEQGNDPELRRVYHNWLFDLPMKFQSELLSWLIKMKILQEKPIDFLVKCFYPPIFFLCQRYLVAGELTEEIKAEFLSQAQVHGKQFLEAFGRNSNELFFD